MEGIALIDVAAEDDLLLLPCPTEGESPAPSIEQSGSPEQKGQVAEMYNLRKSLAWDNAFFTSEGVLNPEELAVVNGTFWTMEQHALPRIQEETYKSSESHTKLARENLMLESLETDLFENLRVSTQNSLDKCDGPCSARTQVIYARNKVNNIPCPSNSKTPVAPGRCPASRQEKSGMMKSVFHTRVNKVTATNGEPKLSLRPPRGASEKPETPNRRISSPHLVRAWNKVGKALPGFPQNIPPKKAAVGQALNISSKSSPLKKASCSSSPAKMLQMSSPMRGGSCDRIRYSKVAPPRRVTAGRPVNIIPGLLPAKKAASSCSSTPTKMLQMASPAHSGSWSSSSSVLSLDNLDKTTLKGKNRSSSSLAGRFTKVPRRKINSRNVNNSSTTPKSIFGFSSGSTSKSVDSLGSASSSSSTSTGRKQVGSMSTDQSSSVCLRTSSEPSSGSILMISTDNDEQNCHCKGNSKGQEFKPSGLRLPTPKIGYFDSDKSAFRNSPRCPRRIQQGALQQSKSGLGDLSGARKGKMNKDQFQTSTNGDSRLIGLSVLPSFSKKLSEDIQISTLGSFSEVGTTQTKAENFHEQTSNIQASISPREFGKIYSEFGVEGVSEVEQDRLFESDMNHGSIFPKSTNSRETKAITGSGLEKSSPSMSKSYDKENLHSFSGSNCLTRRELRAGGPKVATIEQLEKRLSSLKLSLSKADENARDLIPFLENSKFVSEKVESLQSFLNSVSTTPAVFGSLPRTPLSENNYEI